MCDELYSGPTALIETSKQVTRPHQGFGPEALVNTVLTVFGCTRRQCGRVAGSWRAYSSSSSGQIFQDNSAVSTKQEAAAAAAVSASSLSGKEPQEWGAQSQAWGLGSHEVWPSKGNNHTEEDAYDDLSADLRAALTVDSAWTTGAATAQKVRGASSSTGLSGLLAESTVPQGPCSGFANSYATIKLPEIILVRRTEEENAASRMTMSEAAHIADLIRQYEVLDPGPVGYLQTRRSKCMALSHGARSSGNSELIVGKHECLHWHYRIKLGSRTVRRSQL